MRLLVFLALSVVAGAASFEIRPTEGSRFALTVEKTGLMRGRQHLFLFSKFQGTLDFDPAHPEAAQIRLEIDAASADCKDSWVSMKDLKKIQETALEDMLSAKRFPKIVFVSTSVRGAGKFEVPGMLTIRDTTKPVVVAVELDARDPARLKLSGNARLTLTAFGLKPPSAVLGAIGTKDEMSFQFQMEAVTRP